MEQLEAMRQSRGFQHFARGDEAGGIESELRVLAAARAHLPAPLL